jgi:hypothetical protein
VLWLQLGHCQQALGLVGAAENSFLQAKQLNQSCQEASLGLMRLSSVGLWGRARGWWRRLTQ